MIAVHRLGGACVPDLSEDLHDLLAAVAVVRNLPRPVRILNDSVRGSDTGGVLHKNAIGSQLRGVAGIWTRAGALARFELDRHKPIVRLHQVVRFPG